MNNKAIFISFLIRDIDLEMFLDLPTCRFLTAMEEFIVRRRKPVELYSDFYTHIKVATRNYDSCRFPYSSLKKINHYKIVKLINHHLRF